MSNIYRLTTSKHHAPAAPRPHQGEDAQRRTERITGEDLALLSRELNSGTRAALCVREGLELIEEVRWLRQQLQRIRVVSDPARQQALAHDALYGKRPAILLLESARR